ncbi:hypothetical protein Acr_22g0008070 [Actinidia rufa]|uniref:Uncharacterized protein n=1 Tax=Actinidia rufa TaxID=165716 RepID=A0A7J0GKQ9_9ERIC|nr:hypothetical protein Acr_22g0008070 [Actinidia rufa]
MRNQGSGHWHMTEVIVGELQPPMIQCYNNVLRGARDLPITSCIEVTFYRLVATFNDKRRQIESALAKGLRYTSKVQAKLEEYQARSAGHHVTIWHLVLHCRWHGLRVPKARSATLFGRGSPNSQVIKALEREIDEMQRRLDRYHFTEYANKECADPTQRIIEINVDPLLVSDPELSDFSEEEGDDDFVNYLPSSISVAGKPLCCYEHGP